MNERRTTDRRRLRLQRDTVRHLVDDHLYGVAGGEAVTVNLTPQCQSNIQVCPHQTINPAPCVPPIPWPTMICPATVVC